MTSEVCDGAAAQHQAGCASIVRTTHQHHALQWHSASGQHAIIYEMHAESVVQAKAVAPSYQEYHGDSMQLNPYLATTHARVVTRVASELLCLVVRTRAKKKSPTPAWCYMFQNQFSGRLGHGCDLP